MTPSEFRVALASLGVTQRGFAHMIGVSPRSVERWCTEGDPSVPEPVIRIVRASLADRTVLDRIGAA